jgi:hypothetical protein
MQGSQTQLFFLDEENPEASEMPSLEEYFA